ncbi:phage tail fiber protein [Methylibium sp.]|uniref:phage tail fiber protein n=1 Tax=Methylibium sp. TaxID=2067992 RepID=UPI003D09E75E
MKHQNRIARFAAALAITLLAALPTIAPAQALSDYVENKSIDLLLRAQAWTAPSTINVGLSTAACSDSSIGTEVTGGSYARVAVTASLANWAGTQSAGSTSASSGTGGQTSNNAAVTFPTPSAGWGTVTHFFLHDGTNLLVCQALTTSKTINSGDSVSFAIGAITLTLQ